MSKRLKRLFESVASATMHFTMETSEMLRSFTSVKQYGPLTLKYYILFCVSSTAVFFKEKRTF